MLSRYNNAIEMLVELLRNAQYMNQETGYTGRRINENTVSMADAPTGKVWVRAADEEYPAKSVWGTASLANTPVIIGQDITGEWRILYTFKSAALGPNADAADASLLPSVDSDLVKITVKPSGFAPGRVRLSSTPGTLNVFVESFDYPGGHWTGADIALTPPGTAGKKAWCRLALDPRDGTISQVTGALFDTIIALQDSDLPDVPMGMIPLGGVVLTNGQTAITSADMFDGRDNGGRIFLGTRHPSCRYDATLAPTTGDDEDAGYSVGSFWFDTTNDEAHVCLDATAGAAVWVPVSGGGGGSFDVDADTGTPETVAGGDTLTLAGGEGIATAVAATDTVTIGMDVPGLTAAAAPDRATDLVMVYEDAAGGHRKMLVDDFANNYSLVSSVYGSLNGGIANSIVGPPYGIELRLDIPNLVTETVPDLANDLVPYFKNTGGFHRKISMANMLASYASLTGTQTLTNKTMENPVMRGGTDATLGTDLVLTGDFAADVNWTKGAGWTIGSGVATKAAGSATSLEQALAISASRMYRITADITRTAGALTVTLGGTSHPRTVQSSTSITYYVFSSSTANLQFTADATFAGTIDNVTVQEVIANTSYAMTFQNSASNLRAQLVFNQPDNMFFGLDAGKYNLSTGNNVTAFGSRALERNTQGDNNTAIGAYAMHRNTSAFSGVAVGYNAMYSNQDGSNNTAVGVNSMYTNETGSNNTALGHRSLYLNVSGNNNMAIGHESLYNSTASNNTAVGYQSQYSTTSGGTNTSLGALSMYSNLTGNTNVAIGNSALYSNTAGVNNMALGSEALYNTTGNNNAAVGIFAGRENTTGGSNLFLGTFSGRFIADGVTPNTNATLSLFIGRDTKALADSQTNQIVIGYDAIGLGSNTVVIGNNNIVTTGLRGNVGIGTDAPGTKLHVVVSDAVTNAVSHGIRVNHTTSGTPAAGFATSVRFTLESDGNAEREAGRVQAGWLVATDASRRSEMKFYTNDSGGERLAFELNSSGSASAIGFHGTAPIIKPTVTGSRGGNAALASLLTALANYGLIVNSSS